ncbi:hypothetical protein Nepgr_026618 [Nepenthes gracilis]|uniref:Secreted protein n=1 Tax=Nepenthes gracilis TaxID=150966 RepID=A0AAD3T857_NEPGR|nr:hypothetical protein Nepgr_026618 [Nepenthes gracilis]
MRLLTPLALWAVLLAAPARGGTGKKKEEKKKCLEFSAVGVPSVRLPHLLILLPCDGWSWCAGILSLLDVVGEIPLASDGGVWFESLDWTVVSLLNESSSIGCALVCCGVSGRVNDDDGGSLWLGFTLSCGEASAGLYYTMRVMSFFGTLLLQLMGLWHSGPLLGRFVIDVVVW